MKFKFPSDPVQTHAGKMLVGAIVCIFFGVKGIVQTFPLEKLEHHKGHLEWIKEGYVQPKDSSKSIYGVLIKLKEEENVFGTWVAKHKQAIVGKATNNSKIELWLGKMDGEIVQIKINDTMVVAYARFYYVIVPIGFFVVGFFLLAIMVYAIIKHPEVISSRIAEKKGIELD